jgi:hypothetical protein
VDVFTLGRREQAKTFRVSIYMLHDPQNPRATYDAVFRTSPAQPGYAYYLPNGTQPLTQIMQEILDAISPYHPQLFAFVHQETFDQQNTTRFHRDGGPDNSYLLLGYEPSLVPSTLRIADGWRAASQRGESIEDFFAAYPMLSPDLGTVLSFYTTTISAFDHTRPFIVLINNNVKSGVLHQATIEEANSDATRTIHSWMLV